MMETQRLVIMCAFCWKVQPVADYLESEERWLDPSTFLACGRMQAQHYEIIDAYCNPCVMEMALRDERVLSQAAAERTNA